MNAPVDHSYRYQAVADRIQQLIRDRILKSGSRIPSLREMSSLMGVSLNTVREAYSTLEAQYIIEAVPQSGYYVRSLSEELQALPARDPATLDPEETGICQIFARYQESGHGAPENMLAISDLGPELYPSAHLGKAIQDVLGRMPEGVFQYMMPPGYLPLREQICLINGESGTSFPLDELVLTSGCHEALFLALSVLCRPGDTIAVESPCYFNFFQMLERLRLNVIEIPAVAGKGFSVDTLRFILENHDIRAFFTISSFSNPLGFSMTPPKKQEILGLMREFNVFLIEDDIYGNLYFGKERQPTYYSLCRDEEERSRVIHCSSFSKTLGPGLRVGWIVAGKYTEEIIQLKNLLSLGYAPSILMGLSRYLEKYSYVRQLKRTRSRLSRQILAVRKIILESFPSGTTVTQPEGGCALWVTLPGNRNSMELYRMSVKENLLFAPGKLFSLKRDYSNSLRLNGGYWDSRIEKGIRRLGELARTLNDGKG